MRSVYSQSVLSAQSVVKFVRGERTTSLLKFVIIRVIRVYGCFSSQRFWKAGSARKASQTRSSLRRAGVQACRKNSFIWRCNKCVRVEIARLFSPKIVRMNARFSSKGRPFTTSLSRAAK
jgi:hypothetical protein